MTGGFCWRDFCPGGFFPGGFLWLDFFRGDFVGRILSGYLAANTDLPPKGFVGGTSLAVTYSNKIIIYFLKNQLE